MSSPLLWQSHLPGFLPAAVATIGRSHPPLRGVAASAAEAGMMEEAVAREETTSPSFLPSLHSKFVVSLDFRIFKGPEVPTKVAKEAGVASTVEARDGAVRFLDG